MLLDGGQADWEVNKAYSQTTMWPRSNILCRNEKTRHLMNLRRLIGVNGQVVENEEFREWRKEVCHGCGWLPMSFTFCYHRHFEADMRLLWGADVGHYTLFSRAINTELSLWALIKTIYCIYSILQFISDMELSLIFKVIFFHLKRWSSHRMWEQLFILLLK